MLGFKKWNWGKSTTSALFLVYFLNFNVLTDFFCVLFFLFIFVVSFFFNVILSYLIVLRPFLVPVPSSLVLLLLIGKISISQEIAPNFTY